MTSVSHSAKQLNCKLGGYFQSIEKVNGKGIGYYLARLGIAALIISAIALPSGSVYGVPVKYIAYISSFIGVVSQWISGRKIDVRVILIFILIGLFVSFYVLIGAINAATPFGYVLIEATGVFTAVTIVLIAISAKSVGVVTDEELIKFAFYGALIFATWKVMVVLLLVGRVIQYGDVYYFFLNNLGYRPVSSGIYGGLVRFNFIIYDFVVALFLFVIPGFPRLFKSIPVWVRIAFFIIGVPCLVFAFSRLLFVLVLILWFYLFVFKANFKAKFAISSLAMAVIMVSLPWLEGVVEQRFNNVSSVHSDNIRTEQISALLDTWSNSPVIGGGFGFYAKSLIRDPVNPFNYEVQWVGFLTKFGILGVLFLIGLVLILFAYLLKEKRTLDNYALAFILLVFIGGGFTNQYLVSSPSGVFYLALLVMASILRRSSLSSVV